MENTNVSSTKKFGGVVLDILTVGMLFASFAALFYSGFFVKSNGFPLGAMCAVTAVGLILLFFIGIISCVASKARNRSLTLGFLVFSAIQTVALIVNLALLLGLMVKLFSVDDFGPRITYVVTASLVLIGYVASISYFSEGSVAPDEEEDDEETEEYEEEEADEDDQDGEADEADEIEELAETDESDGYEEADEEEEQDDDDEPDSDADVYEVSEKDFLSDAAE